MKSAPVTLPPVCAQRVGPELAARIVGAGETALLAEPLLGLIVCRECPGHVLLETLERVPEWVKAGRVIVSGFHSPLEQLWPPTRICLVSAGVKMHFLPAPYSSKDSL